MYTILLGASLQSKRLISISFMPKSSSKWSQLQAREGNPSLFL